MADTYSKLYFHIIFAVRGREFLISKKWNDELYKYISGVVSNHEQMLLLANGMPDHIHLLISTSPNCNLSYLVRDIKTSSTKWINNRRLVKGKFTWQNGYGAFTVGHAQLSIIKNYIKNQEKHHSKLSFKEEYKLFLDSNNIKYKPEYLFD